MSGAPPPPPPSNAAVGMPPPPKKSAQGGMMPPPPPSSGPNLQGSDKVLFEMQSALFDFYTKHAPEKISSDIFALALQLWWDIGLSGLNAILISKYGCGIDASQDVLENFDRKGEDVTIIPKSDLNAKAGKQHLLVKTMLKTNTAEYFQINKTKVENDMRKSFNKGMSYQEYLKQYGAAGEKDKSIFMSSDGNLGSSSAARQKEKSARSGKVNESITKSKKNRKKHKKHKKKKKKSYSSSSSSSSSDSE